MTFDETCTLIGEGVEALPFPSFPSLLFFPGVVDKERSKSIFECVEFMLTSCYRII